MMFVVSQVISMMATYACLDAVIPDLDSPEAVPAKLKWTLEQKPNIAREYLALLYGTKWKFMDKLEKQNLTIEYSYSKAYERDLLKFTTFFNKSVEEVKDSLWLDQYIPERGWGRKSLLANTKMLGYAGRSVAIFHQESKPVSAGWFVAPRDYIAATYLYGDSAAIRSLLLRSRTTTAAAIDSVTSSYDDISGLPSLFGDQRGSAVGEKVGQLLSRDAALVLATNASGTVFDLPPRDSETVRVLIGTMGIVMADVSSPASTERLTRVEWIVNSDGRPPTFMPRSASRLVMSNTMKAGIQDWKSYIGSKNFLRHHDRTADVNRQLV